MRSLSYGELLRTKPNFRNLLAGQFISELGNWFNFIAGLGLVRLVSDASPRRREYSLSRVYCRLR